MMIVSLELPMESGNLIEKALDKARDDESPDISETPWSAKQADALVDMARSFLNGSDKSTSSDNHLVTVHVDQSALAGNGGRSALPLESVKRICCDSHAVVITENDKGEPLSIGRKSRIIPKAIERAVRSRDKNQCRFPGCRNYRFLNCHHVEHWSNGGETAVENLMLLCTKHHTAVHEGGFRIDKDFNDDWCFFRPDGIAVPDIGYVERPFFRSVNNPPRGGFLNKMKNRALESPAPVYLH